MGLRRAFSVLTSIALAIAGCAPIVGADFDGYRAKGASSSTSDTDPPTDDGTATTDPSSPPSSSPSSSSSTTPPSTPPSSPPGTPPSSSGKCSGASWSCDVLAVDHARCATQTGCTWVAPSCTLSTVCSKFTTNTSCENAPGCATDFSTSTCKPIAGYCVGSTKPGCEIGEGCVYAGGCGGTVKSCDAIVDQATCKTQSGCTWS